jgi:opacity protein-like surface antigen
MGETTFAASLATRYALGVFDTATPYVSGGIGMFQATFDRGWKGAPAFYRDRVDSDAGTGRRVFRDVLWSVGAGADLEVTNHLALRPDLSLLIVTTRRDARVVPVYGLHLAYYFVPRDRAH